MSTFDLTFDRTFRPALTPTTQPTALDTCRKPGIYLTWLTPLGWSFWLFDGKLNRGLSVSSIGQVTKAGVPLNNKQQTPIYTVRAPNLTEVEADVIASIYASPAVYLKAVDKSGRWASTLVSIELGTFDIWRSGQGRGGLEVRFSLPPTTMQRV